MKMTISISMTVVNFPTPRFSHTFSITIATIVILLESNFLGLEHG